MSYARAGSSPAFGTNHAVTAASERLVRPWPGALSPAFGTNHAVTPASERLVRPWPGALSPAFGTNHAVTPASERLVRPWPGVLTPALLAGAMAVAGPGIRILARREIAYEISRFFGCGAVDPGRVGTYNAQPRIWAGMTRPVQRELPRGFSQSRKF